jgi:hypothetical protein
MDVKADMKNRALTVEERPATINGLDLQSQTTLVRDPISTKSWIHSVSIVELVIIIMLTAIQRIGV